VGPPPHPHNLEKDTQNTAHQGWSMNTRCTPVLTQWKHLPASTHHLHLDGQETTLEPPTLERSALQATDERRPVAHPHPTKSTLRNTPKTPFSPGVVDKHAVHALLDGVEVAHRLAHHLHLDRRVPGVGVLVVPVWWVGGGGRGWWLARMLLRCKDRRQQAPAEQLSAIAMT
jgi:hypothetical protein